MNHMIERLQKEDLREAARVYKRGLELEIPIGNAKLEKVLKDLRGFTTFVYKQENRIKGLVTFTFKTEFTIDMIFICSMVFRKRIGTKLMKRLAEYATK